jgi:hypothetical protein
MPYNVQRAGSKYEVVQSQTGRVVGTHPTKEQAQAQLAALYANVKDAKKSDGFSNDPSPTRDSANDVSSIAYSTPPGITNVDTINRLKQIINGSKSNRNPKKEEKEKSEQPIINNWEGMFFPKRG